MDSLDLNNTTNTQMVATPAPKKKSSVLKVIAIILVILGLCFATWYYQQRQIDQLKQDVSQLQNEKQKAVQDLASLQQKIADENTNNITVSYSAVIRDTDKRYGSTGGLSNGTADVIIVQFTATNNGTATYTLKASDFDLKTSDGTALAKYANTPALQEAVRAFNLPDNLTVFENYNLKPGEKVNGSLVYWNTKQSAAKFTMTYNNASKDLAVTKTTKVCTREGTSCS